MNDFLLIPYQLEILGDGRIQVCFYSSFFLGLFRVEKDVRVGCHAEVLLVMISHDLLEHSWESIFANADLNFNFTFEIEIFKTDVII